MTRIVYEFPSSKRSDVEALLDEDPLSRQSVTVKDSDSLGLDRDTVLVFLQGDEDVLEEAEAEFRELGGEEPAEAEELQEKLDEEEQAAAGGVGFIFGE